MKEKGEREGGEREREKGEIDHIGRVMEREETERRE